MNEKNQLIGLVGTSPCIKTLIQRKLNYDTQANLTSKFMQVSFECTKGFEEQLQVEIA